MAKIDWPGMTPKTDLGGLSSSMLILNESEVEKPVLWPKHNPNIEQNDKEVALKPVEASKEHQKIGYKHDCPKCHCSLGYKEKAYGILPRLFRKTVLYEVCQSYCGFCGQKIDWSDIV